MTKLHAITKGHKLRKCGWPGCTATSTQPFKDGWASADIDFGMTTEWLCPRCAERYEAFAINAIEGEPPTETRQ